MFGKHFASMYEGSMRGSGSAFFAVWGYIISHMTPHKELCVVDLNHEIIAFLLGEKPEIVEKVINQMCHPDLKSKTKDHEGRKLLKLSEFNYEVVNGPLYRKIRNQEDRKEYQRIKQAEYRAKKESKSTEDIKF